MCDLLFNTSLLISILRAMYAKLRFVALGVLSSIAAASVNPPSGWTYQGCYSDSTYTRWLTGYGFADSSSMSYELCTQTCFSAGYAVAGVEYGGVS